MMSSLDNLVRIGKLKTEPPAQAEINGLVRSGLARLADAQSGSISIDGRFDLAYSAGHALALAALRWQGYRSDNRYLVFQTLTHTVGLPNEQWRVLDAAHQKRNVVEYEGLADVDEELVAAVIRVVKEIAARVVELGSVSAD
jgi:hypothetical protein